MDAPGDDDGDLWAQEALKFAQAGLEAVQHLRERKSAAPPPTAPAQQATTAPAAPAEPLLRSSDFKGVEAKADEPKAKEDGPMARDADGDLGALARIDDADDYVRFEGASSSSEDEEEGGGGTSKKKATYIKLPEIRGVGLSGVRDIDMDDVRQQAMLAQMRRKQANFLDTVRSLNNTNLQMHAREYAPTMVREGSLCEIIFEVFVDKVEDDGTTKRAGVTMPALKINFVGSLEFLDSDEEREMFHNLDAKPWKDKIGVTDKASLPDWAKERLESLEEWLKGIDSLVDGFKFENPETKTIKPVLLALAENPKDAAKLEEAATAASEYSKSNKGTYLDINDYVGWTYLYRFLSVEEVAVSVLKLTAYLFPMNLFEEFKEFEWLFTGREKVLKQLSDRMPSPGQMIAFSSEATELEKIKQSMGIMENNKTDVYAQGEASSYTWSFMFMLLFFRQILAHEFFMFATYKQMVAPILETSPALRRLYVNVEETKDDFMHSKWHEVLNRFSLFRDTLMGRQDDFTKFFQRYMNLAHERLKISHERNMVRSEEQIYKLVISTLEDDESRDAFENAVEAEAQKEGGGDTGAVLRIIFELPIFKIVPPKKDTSATDAGTDANLLQRAVAYFEEVRKDVGSTLRSVISFGQTA